MNSPKLSLANMLLLVTVAALSFFILFDYQKRTASIDGGYFEFDVPEASIRKSTWIDLSQSPELDMVSAAAIGTRVSDYLDSRREEIGHDNWQISSIALHNLEIELGEENAWAYIICLTPEDRYPSRPGVEAALYIQIAITLDGEGFYDSEIENEQVLDALEAAGLKDLSS